MVSESFIINESCIINELFSTFSVYSLIIYHWKPNSKSLSEMGKSIGDHAYVRGVVRHERLFIIID